MATPAPTAPIPEVQPTWMENEDYEYYVEMFGKNPDAGKRYWKSIEIVKTKAGIPTTLPTKALQPIPVDPELELGIEPSWEFQLPEGIPGGPELPKIMTPGQYQFKFGTGMYDRPVQATGDRAQINAYTDQVEALIAGGWEKEEDIIRVVDQDLRESWKLEPGPVLEQITIMPFDDEAVKSQKREIMADRASQLADQDWAEKTAFIDIYGEEGTPRRPRATSFGQPAPSMGTSLMTQQPERVAEMGPGSAMWEALKPQVLETEEMVAARAAKEDLYKASKAEAEEQGIEWGVWWEDHKKWKLEQFESMAETNFLQYTGKPREVASPDEIKSVAKALYMSYLNQNWPEEYRSEERRGIGGPIEPAYGIEANQEGMFFKVWGDAIHRGFLTTEVDPIGLRTVLYNVGILEEPDAITETMAGALVRDIAGITRLPINVVKDLTTYEVNPYTGEAVYDSFWDDVSIGIPVETLGGKESRAWGKSLSPELLRNESGWDDYWRRTAYEIATLRTLGDDVASVSWVPESQETAWRIGGLGAELLIPLSPGKYLRAAGEITKATGKVALRTPIVGPKLGAGLELVSPIVKAPVSSMYNATKRYVHITQPLAKANKQTVADLVKAGVDPDDAVQAARYVTDYFDTSAKNVSRIVESNTYANRRAAAFGQGIDDLVEVAAGFEVSVGAQKLAAVGVTPQVAEAFIKALRGAKPASAANISKLNKMGRAFVGIGERVGNQVAGAALKEVQTLKELKVKGIVTNADELRTYRIAQGIEGESPFVNLAKEEFANSIFADFVPISPRVLVAKETLKENYAKFIEVVSNDNAVYKIDRTSANGDFLGYKLTTEGMEQFKDVGGVIGEKIRKALARGDDFVDLTVDQSFLFAEKMAEKAAAEVFGTADIIRPTRAGRLTEAAFIPESRRTINVTSKIFRDAMGRTLQAMRETPLIRKIVPSKKIKVPVFADEMARGIEEAIIQLDKAIPEMARMLVEKGLKGDDAFEAMLAIALLDGKGGLSGISIPKFLKDPDGQLRLLREMGEEGLVIEQHFGIGTRSTARAAGIKILSNHLQLGVDAHIVNKILLPGGSAPKMTGSKWTSTDVEQFAKAFEAEFPAAATGPLEYFNPSRLEKSLDSLAPRLREFERIEPLSMETFGLIHPDIEGSILEIVFQNARNGAVQRAIKTSIGRGGAYVADAVGMRWNAAPRLVGGYTDSVIPAAIMDDYIRLKNLDMVEEWADIVQQLVAAKAQHNLKYGFFTSSNSGSIQSMARSIIDFEIEGGIKFMPKTKAANLSETDLLAFIDDITEPWSAALLQNMRTAGIVSGYVTDAEFYRLVQIGVREVGEYKVFLDADTLRAVNQLEQSVGAMANKTNASRFSSNFYDARRRDPTFVGKVLADLNMMIRAGRRNIVNGQLAGKYLPNVTYQSENTLTAALITSVTAPEYVTTVLAQSARSLGIPIPRGTKGLQFGKLTPWQEIRGAVMDGRGAEVMFKTETGLKITYKQAMDIWLRNNTGMSNIALNLGDVFINDVKNMARTTKQYIPLMGMKVSKSKWQNFASAMGSGRTPSYGHWANGSDQAMREAVFFSAVQKGIPERVAGELARNAVLDYGKIPVWFRQKMAGIFLYTSFMYRMSAETALALFRTETTSRVATKATALSALLSGTPLQNLQRLAQLKRDVHKWSGLWLFGDDYTKSTLWSTYLGEYDGTDAYTTYLRDPVIGQVVMFGQLIDYAVAVGGGYSDKPIAQRSLQGFLDVFYSPSIDLLMEVQKVRAGKSVPSKWVAGSQRLSMVPGMETFWPDLMAWCDIVPKGLEKQRPGEPQFMGKQFKFATATGVERFLWLNWATQVAGSQRITNDMVTMYMMTGQLPPGTYPFRYRKRNPVPEGVSFPGTLSDGALYLIFRERAVKVPKEWQAKDAVLRQNIRQLEQKRRD